MLQLGRRITLRRDTFRREAGQSLILANQCANDLMQIGLQSGEAREIAARSRDSSASLKLIPTVRFRPEWGISRNLLRRAGRRIGRFREKTAKMGALRQRFIDDRYAGAKIRIGGIFMRRPSSGGVGSFRVAPPKSRRQANSAVW
jgi:hypothetical protein